jgi:hypothetical protein
MLLPPLCTQSDYVNFAKAVGFKVYSEPFDISKQVAKTWSVMKMPHKPSYITHEVLEKYAKIGFQGHFMGAYTITCIMGLRPSTRPRWTGFLPII